MKLSPPSLFSGTAKKPVQGAKSTHPADPIVVTVEEQDLIIRKARRERYDAAVAAKAVADRAAPRTAPAIAAAPAPSTPLAPPPPVPPAPPAITAAERERDNARALAAARAMHGRTFAPQQHTMDAWMTVARLRARRDGCDIPTALLRCGFVTADLSIKPDTGGATKA